MSGFEGAAALQLLGEDAATEPHAACFDAGGIVPGEGVELRTTLLAHLLVGDAVGRDRVRNDAAVVLVVLHRHFFLEKEVAMLHQFVARPELGADRLVERAARPFVAALTASDTGHAAFLSVDPRDFMRGDAQEMHCPSDVVRVFAAFFSSVCPRIAAEDALPSLPGTDADVQRLSLRVRLLTTGNLPLRFGSCGAAALQSAFGKNRRLDDTGQEGLRKETALIHRRLFGVRQTERRFAVASAAFEERIVRQAGQVGRRELPPLDVAKLHSLANLRTRDRWWPALERDDDTAGEEQHERCKESEEKAVHRNLQKSERTRGTNSKTIPQFHNKSSTFERMYWFQVTLWYDSAMKKPTFPRFLLQFIMIIIGATLVVVYADKIL